MDLGLGNLISLKRHLLHENLRDRTDFDTVLQEIGTGVAKAFEQYCKRKFVRVVDDTYVVNADRDHIYVPRYPIESVSTVELREDKTVGWETQTNAIQNYDEESGLIYFGARMGPWWSYIRVTYTGGYWYDTSETETDTIPTGANALPSDLKLAWLLQAQHIWENRDKLGVNIGAAPGQTSRIDAIQMAPQVVEMLQSFIRFQLS